MRTMHPQIGGNGETGHATAAAAAVRQQNRSSTRSRNPLGAQRHEKGIDTQCQPVRGEQPTPRSLKSEVRLFHPRGQGHTLWLTSSMRRCNVVVNSRKGDDNATWTGLHGRE